MNAADIITHFAMLAHPEGGFHRHSYRKKSGKKLLYTTLAKAALYPYTARFLL